MGVKLSGFKSLGPDGWVGFFSNIFYDRDIKPDAPRGERFTLDAWKEAVEWMNDGNLPVLEFWHMRNAKIGQATDTYMVGPFVIAEGVWLDEDLGQKAQAYFEKSDEDWRMSHGFTYRLADRKDGEYHKVRPHEITVLPGRWAANPITVFTEGKMGSLKQDLVRAFGNLTGMGEDDAKAAVEEALQQSGKSLPDGEAAGQKDADTEATEGEVVDTGSEPEGDQTAPSPDEGDVDVSDDELAAAFVDVLTELREERSLRQELTAKVDELEKSVKALQSDTTGVKALGGIDQRVKALEDADAKRIEALPKAVRKALSARAADNGGKEVTAEEAVEDLAAREAALQGKQSKFTNGVDWTIEQMRAGEPSAG